MLKTAKRVNEQIAQHATISQTLMAAVLVFSNNFHYDIIQLIL